MYNADATRKVRRLRGEQVVAARFPIRSSTAARYLVRASGFAYTSRSATRAPLRATSTSTRIPLFD